MVFKIKTSKRTMEAFELISGAEYFQPFILAKLALSLSIKAGGSLLPEDFETDSNGLELNRQTITGEFDALFKGLIEMRERKHLEDDEYFQKYMKAHLDRGAKMLESEYRYSTDFITSLLSKEKGL